MNGIDTLLIKFNQKIIKKIFIHTPLKNISKTFYPQTKIYVNPTLKIYQKKFQKIFIPLPLKKYIKKKFQKKFEHNSVPDLYKPYGVGGKPVYTPRTP